MWSELQSQAWEKLNLRNVGFFKIYFSEFNTELASETSSRYHESLCSRTNLSLRSIAPVLYHLRFLPLSAYSQITKVSIWVSPGSMHGSIRISK